MKDVLNRKVSWDPTCMVLGTKPRRSANKWWAIYAMFRITQQVFWKDRVYKKTLCVECQNPNIRTSKIIEKKPLPWGYRKFYLIIFSTWKMCLLNSENITPRIFSVFLLSCDNFWKAGINSTKIIVSLFLVYFNMHLFSKILYSNKDFAVIS